MLDPQNIKKDFPIFKNFPGLVYLDSAATSLKPNSVISKITEYYTQYSANIHRGLYKISEKASLEYEGTRGVVAKFINANSPQEIVFTRNATEGINLIMQTLGRQIVEEGDEIVTTIMEHHANFIPWQQLAFSAGADFKVIHLDDNYELAITNYELPSFAKALEGQANSLVKDDQKLKVDLTGIITKKTKILALTLISNTLGVINPVKQIIQKAKEISPNIITIVDAAQAVPHLKIDVQDLGCDFLVFSSHKMLGPTGVGVLWGKFSLLSQMPPYQFGGDMIRSVSISETTFADAPHKFEAGTPDIAGVIGLKAAIRYLESVGLDNIHAHEEKLTTFAIEHLVKEFGEAITIFCFQNEKNRAGIVSFTLKNIHPHDIAQILDEENIAVRAGHHCTMPLHNALGVPATTRASFYLYNTEEDVEKLVEGLKKVKKVFRSHPLIS